MEFRVICSEMTFSHETVHPLFGEGTIKLTLEDEGGGCFFTLKQDENEIRLDDDEFELILEQMKIMKSNYEALAK